MKAGGTHHSKAYVSTLHAGGRVRISYSDRRMSPALSCVMAKLGRTEAGSSIEAGTADRVQAINRVAIDNAVFIKIETPQTLPKLLKTVKSTN